MLFFGFARISAQDIIYTVNGEYENCTISLDSIVLENLSNNSKTVFWIGSNSVSNCEIDILANSKSSPKQLILKAGFLSNFYFNKGDSIRISAFKHGYYAYPKIDVIQDSKQINFSFKRSSVESTGSLSLIVNEETLKLKPGNIIPINLDTTGYPMQE